MYDKNEFDDNEFPIAYFITFRTYGTWLHGDQRTSIRRNRRSKTENKVIEPNVPFEDSMRDEMVEDSLFLDRRQRKEVETAIKELCKARGYTLYAINVRSNHVHVVVGVAGKPERVADAFKAFATRRLRELNLVASDRKLWSRGRSRKYLWKPNQVSAAIDYVLYCQSDMPFELDD
ncbi:MAG: transposase [Blastocatellia bacterium]|nr:transposase [Blastocatellia bacterium]